MPTGNKSRDRIDAEKDAQDAFKVREAKAKQAHATELKVAADNLKEATKDAKDRLAHAMAKAAKL